VVGADRATLSEFATNAALAPVDGIQPQNEAEAMLATQMAATHNVAMEMLGRAKFANTVPAIQEYGNLATKVLRTYTAQLEALAKVRRGGEPMKADKPSSAQSDRPGVEGVTQKQSSDPMDLVKWRLSLMRLAPRCGARTKSGSPCQSPAMMKGRKRCRLHGGAKGSGGPLGEAKGTIVTECDPAPIWRRYAGSVSCCGKRANC
jgi:hypothetical protein